MSKAQRLQSSPSKHSLTRYYLQELAFPAALLVIVFVFGTLGFFIVGEGRWSLFDCAYMTSITLTTVGYGEILQDFGTSGRSFRHGSDVGRDGGSSLCRIDDHRVCSRAEIFSYIEGA